MSRMTKKGLATALLVGLLVAPVAAAASAERAEERGAPAVAGWFEELVEWVGGWLLGRGDRIPDRSPTGANNGEVTRFSAEHNCEGGGSMDPLGAC